MTAVLAPEAAATTRTDWPASWGPAPKWATPRTPERRSFGPIIGRLAARMGAPLFPWQQYVADVALEVDEDGHWFYDEVMVTAPRRSGKTFLTSPVTAHRCGQKTKTTAWITAQTLKSAVRRWEDIADQINNSALRSNVKKNRGNPQMLRWPATGSAFLPFAPNEDALHGEDPDLVWVDEQWAFSFEDKAEIEQGYDPVFSVKHGQVWKMSTAGTERSEWFNEDRRAGRAAVEAGRRSGLAFFDWGAPERVGGVPIERLPAGEILRIVLDSHPRRDHGLRPEFLAKQLEKSKINFLRAYGNISQNADAVEEDAVFSSEQMRANRGGQIPETARIALGVAADPDRRDAVISVAWRGPDGRALTSYKHADGTRWVVPEVLSLVKDYEVAVVAIQSAGPARDIADALALKLEGAELLRVSQADSAAAGARFHDEFAAGLIGWDGSLEFSAAVAAAEPHRLQSGIEWRSTTGAPVTALPAGSVAVWGIDHVPEPEELPPPFKIL